MQRTCSEDDTPYINHGVIANHTKLKNASFTDNENTKTDSRITGKHSCPEKETRISKEPRGISGAQIIRQNLARDFPMHRPQVTLRPGSPAEIFKHRIHTVNEATDLEELQGMQTLTIQGKTVKPWEIRKSLSSTCVSPYTKTVSVQCQTTDDLVGNVLPPLRRRYVSKKKNKLERSEAVEEFTGSVPDSRKEFHVVKCPSRNDSKSLTIRRSHGCRTPSDYNRRSPAENSETFPLMACHNFDHDDLLVAPEAITVESSMSNTCFDDRRQSIVPRPDYQLHHTDIGRQDFSRPSPILTFSPSPSPRGSSRQVCTPFDCSDSNAMEGINKSNHDAISICNNQSIHLFRHPRNLPEPGASPTNQTADESPRRQDKIVSSNSPKHHDSHTSPSVSVASSSSFTFSPFRSSTDTNPSQLSFDDSYNSLDLEQCVDGAQNNVNGDNESEELNDIHGILSSQPKGDYIVNSTENITEEHVVPLEIVDNEKDDMLEFHKYLQVRGVKIELPTLQSSDV